MTPFEIIALLVAFVGGIWLGLSPRSPLSRGVEVPPAKPTKPPEKTANAHKNEGLKESAEAVVVAADSHGVDPDIVADDLDWLRGDDM